MDITTFIKHLYFLVSVAWILFYEWSVYLLSGKKKYGLFIETLTDRLSKKNILYVKIFQACALNNNFIDEVLNNQLMKYADQAPWSVDEDIDIEMLYKFEKEYKIKILNEYTPINTGMISLVFKGERIFDDDDDDDADDDAADDGDKNIVVLKIKRKNIEEKLNAGIAHLLFFLQIVDYLPFINTYGLPDIIHKNIDLISKQTDFPAEIRNILHFKKVCANLKYVVIPHVSRGITVRYPNIIMMEYIKGDTIYRVEKADYAIYSKRVMQFFFVTMLMHGVMHGDLHVGNILFIKDEGAAAGACAETENEYQHKIGILDFGIIYEIGETRNILFDIFSELCASPPAEIANKMLLSGLIEPIAVIKKLPLAHYQSIVGILTAFITETLHVNKKIQLMYLFKFLKEMNQYIAENKLVELTIMPSADLLKIQMMFGMLHGVILTLCHDCDYIDYADKVLKETFHLELLLENI
jgi:predicted unusual protein kinase regulating ubiquinone biosynthesis (AarF/ABC1/UbiB family)